MDITSYLNQGQSLPVSIAGTSKTSDTEKIGFAGFTMYAIIEESRDLNSTAPDVTLEDGSKVNDTIYLDPIVLNISGSIMDVHYAKESEEGVLGTTEQVIGVIDAYLPEKTSAQISKARSVVDDIDNTIAKINTTIEDGQQILGAFGDKSGSKSLQEQFLDVIDQIHFSKALIPIEFPYRVYENMRITNVKTTQTGESNELKFTITAKQLSFRKLETVLVESTEPAPKPSTGLEGATESEADKGTTTGTEVEEEKSQSLLSSVLG